MVSSMLFICLVITRMMDTEVIFNPYPAIHAPITGPGLMQPKPGGQFSVVVEENEPSWR